MKYKSSIGSYNKHKEAPEHNFLRGERVCFMLEMLKSKKTAMLMSNLAGMISGIALGITASCLVKRYLKDRNSLKGKAKRAFKTIEDTISM
jgi:hypothetical protein